MFEAQRDFVTIAREQLDVLGAAGLQMQWQIIGGACDIIHTKAGNVRARGVALCAQQCMTAANREDETACAQMIGAMTQLIEQYATGLAEVDTPDAIAIYKGLKPSHALAPVNMHQPDRSVMQNAARDTLASTLKYANSTETAALTKLIALSRPANDQTESAQAPLQAFETLMLPLTNATLSHAHHHDLRVSLSYDGSETELSQDLASTFKAALCALSQYRIETALCAKPATLHHIALTAQQSPSGLTVRYEDGGAAEQSARLDELPAIIELAAAGGWLANDGDAIILHCPVTRAAEPSIHDEFERADNMMEALA